MAQFNEGDAVQVGTMSDARHGVVTALVTEPNGGQSYDVTMADDGAEPVRVRESDLAPFAGAPAAAAVTPETPATLVAQAETLLAQAEREVKQAGSGQS